MPLTFIAFVKAEEFKLLGCLYALGNDVDRKISGKKDYGLNNGPGAGVSN
jgi:hypothetical protein